MSELDELYQELIKDHSKRPHNFRVPEGADRQAEGYNPLCGDRFTVYVRMEGEVIRDIGFQGTGCAISTASASMMAQALKGKTRAEAEDLFQRFHRLLTTEGSTAEAEALDKLAVFAGVRKFPLRVKCATLGWHTARAALEGENKTVSTE